MNNLETKDYSILNQFVKQAVELAGGMFFKDPHAVTKEHTVLLIIDAQQCVLAEYLEKEMLALGMDPTPYLPLLAQIDEINYRTVGNIKKIIDACRDKSILPIYVKVESLLPDASDVSHQHKKTNVVYPKGSGESTIIKEIAPLEDDIVLTKTCSGVHVGTNIDKILRNLNTETVLVTGFYTDQCVSTSVRDLADLGYNVTLIKDACAAQGPLRHTNALESLIGIYCAGEDTESIVDRINKI